MNVYICNGSEKAQECIQVQKSTWGRKAGQLSLTVSLLLMVKFPSKGRKMLISIKSD